MLKSLKLKKWTSLVVAFILTFSLMSQGLSTVAKAATGDKIFDIIEITDFHGALEDSSGLPVAAVLAKNIKDIKAANPDKTLILGGGDLYQGSPVSNVLYGVPVQKVMTNIGMEVTALGNHEFDWGLDKITNTTMFGSGYEILSANLYHKKDDGTKGSRVFKPYKVITKDGVRIAVIGTITEETPSIVMPAYVENFIFTSSKDEVNAVAKEIKDGNLADVIIAVVHSGDNKDAKTGELFEIATASKNVDAVFGGHSHTIVSTTVTSGDGKTIPVYLANNAGKGFIHAKMTVATDGTVSFAGEYKAIDTTAANGYKAASPAKDAEVDGIVAAAKTEIGPIFGEVIGQAAQELTRKQAGVPYGESYLGNWVADVIKKNAGADVGMQNNGGIRIDIPAGAITVGTMFYIMPFDNEINKVTVTKAQLKTILEQAFGTFPDPKDATKTLGGKGIQISGIKVKFDSTKPYGSKIVDITREDGTALPETVTVAGPDFILTGGDGFEEFKDASIKGSIQNNHVLVRDALIADVKANKRIETVMNTRIENVVKTISVLATSDIHGNIYPLDYYTGKAADHGLAKVSTFVKSQRFVNPYTMLVDNGDTIQGTPLNYYFNKIDTTSEYPMMKVMGAMGYETWTLGNHEFNFGIPTLNRIIEDAEKNGIKALSANTYNTSGTNFVEPYYIKTFNVNGKNIKVGILGMTTKTIRSWENEDNVKGLEFNDLVAEGKKWVPIIKAQGADVVIATIHSGIESATDTIPENQIEAVAKGVDGIDAIVAGHTHKEIQSKTYTNPSGKTVLVTQPNRWGTFVSQIDITVNPDGSLGAISTKAVKMDAYAADKYITDIVAKSYQDKTLEYINTVIGKATGEFSGKDQTMKPTAIMDLINKVQMEAAGTQLSIAAPLSASALIPSGDIRIKDVMSVYVYENFLYGVNMNGAQIKKWMEHSVRYYKQATAPSEAPTKDPVLNAPDYNLDFLYGASYDVDLTQPVGSRIKNLKYNGKLVKDTDTFTVAINNYRFNGGGGFMAEAGLTPGDNSIVVYDSAKALGDDGQVRSLMMEYITKSGTITPDVADNWALSTTTVTQEVEKIEGNLPDTGSLIDFNAVAAIGGTSTLLGAAFILIDKKRRKKQSA